MKLRIHGNSLRLRLSESDLSRLRWEGRLESWMGLGPGRRFTYSVESNSEADHISALYESDALTVLVPREWVDRCDPSDDEICFESMQDIDGDQQLHIVVEKDLLCRHDGQEQRMADQAAA